MRSYLQYSRVRVLLGILLLAPFASSCDTVAVTSVAVASVDVVPTTVELVTGQTTQLSVVALDGSGSQLSTSNVQWTATPAEVAQVDGSGRVTALAPGVAVISASTGGVVGNATASVGVPGLLALSATELTFVGPAGEPPPPSQSVEIGVGDDGRIRGLAANVVYGSAATGWLTATLSSDRAPAVLWVTATTGALPEGVYDARVDVTSNSATNSPMNVRVSFVVEPALPVIQLSPTRLSFAGSQTKPARIENVGAGKLVGLTVVVEYEANQPTGWITLGLSSPSAPATVVVATDDSALPPGNHTARVVVRSSNPDVVPAVLPVALQGGQQAPLLEVVPDSVFITANAGGAATVAIDVRNAGTGALAGLRKAVGYAAGQPVGWLVTTLSSTTAPSILSLTASAAGLAVGQYNASVEMLADAPNSPVLVPVLLTVTPVSILPPAAPTGLTALPGNVANSAALAWTDASANETGFEVRRRVSGGTWAVVATPAADAQAFVDTGLTAGSTYEYAVRACNSAACSAWSTTATVTLPVPIVPPAAPTGLTATAGTASASMAWTDASVNETGFEVQRRDAGGTLTIVASLPANTQSYVDSGLTAGATYDYTVRACNSAGCSVWSNIATVTVPGATKAPTKPGNPVLTVLSAIDIDVAWADNSTNEVSFDLQRRTSSTSWTIIASPGADVALYRDTGLTPGVQYRYRVRACNSAGCSKWTSTIRATTQNPTTVPTSPTAPTIVSASRQQVVMTWTDLSADETYFQVEEGSLTTSWTVLGQVGVNVTTFTDTQVVFGSPIFYRVRACNPVGCSGAFTTIVIVP